ncbi:MAG: ATP-dependent helicase [Magnetococcales bacterium]|nr:ATP-dependent helicase [Magnetococcales bacterium]
MSSSRYQPNDNQRRAIAWNDGPLLVLAGPGSGKTAVLTHRAARLLKEFPDSSVLGLTFTTKAADEMRERLNALIGGRTDRARLCTFHSFSGDILRQHGSHVGIQPDFSVLTLDEDRMAILEYAMTSLKCDTSSIPHDRKNLLVILEYLFRESYDGEPKISGMVPTPPWIPELFLRYCELLQQSNRLCYGGLLYFARKLLSGNAGVARLTRLTWQFICVDEFQDTNRAQYDLLKLLVDDQQPNLFIVADDDQIVYQWNGASPERLLALQDDFNMELVQLPKNYRCPPVIITMANKLIGHNKTRAHDKQPLEANKSIDSAPVLKLKDFPNVDEEVMSIPTAIKQAGWVPGDCVVLARSTKLLVCAAKKLSAHGMTPHLLQRKNEFECASVRWMHAVLKLANARHDREFLRRVCVTWRDFTEISIKVNDVEAAAALNGGDFLRAWVDAASMKIEPDMKTSAKVDPNAIRSLLDRVGHDLVDRLTFMKLLEWFWANRWLDNTLEVEEINTWRELHGTLMQAHSPEHVSLHLYLQEMDLKSKSAARVPDSIPCLTVHGAKGMEFKHVFLIGMADEVFPSYQAVRKGDYSREMEEERRACFVAITRTEETLHMSWAHSYNGYRKNPSRFIEEMGLQSLDSNKLRESGDL